MSNKQMRVMRAYPDQGAVLSSVQIYNEFWPLIEKDPILLPEFTETKGVQQDIFNRTKQAKCKSCQIGKSGNKLICAFVRDLKSLEPAKQSAAISILGKRTVVVLNDNWINLATNEVTPAEYDTSTVQDPRVNLVPEPAVNDAIPEGARETTPLPWEASPANSSPPAKQESVPAEPPKDDGKRRVILQNFQAPGDIVMITAAVRDLHINYPGKFITDVRTSSLSIWESNPYISPLEESDPRVEVHKLEYPLINQSNQGPWHFSESFTEEIEDKLGVRIKKRLGKGDIHIGPNEEGWGQGERTKWFSEYGYDPEVNYWILNAGWKNDFTCKMWPSQRYQKVVDHFRDRLVFVQVGHESHNHPELEGVINLVGKTDDRQLIRLVWSSSGVVTPVSYPMTLAAAIPVRVGKCMGQPNRPCVVIAGGREPNQWQTHANHQFIHCCGALPCCPSGGCWASRFKPIGDNDEKDRKHMCKYVVHSEDGEELPYCMDIITADEVIRRMETYLGFFTPGRRRTHTYNK